MPRRLLPLLLFACSAKTPGTYPDPDTVRLSGRVVSAAGPVGRATVAVAGQTTEADSTGSFSVDVPEGAQLVRASAPGYHPRTVAADKETEIFLYPDDTFELVVSGEMILGPGFVQDAETLVGGNDAFAARFGPVSTLTVEADAFVPTLDTVLVTGGIPHPTRPVQRVAPPAAAVAFPVLGADVVSLAATHAYDRLDEGVEITYRTLLHDASDWTDF